MTTKTTLDPKRFTAYKRSVQSIMYQWDAVSGLTFEEAHTFTGGDDVPDKDGYFMDKVHGKYRWTVCVTEYYRGNGN